MRSPLYNNELEDFLRQQADDHRMYPSDKLWRNIQQTLHGETRWPALTYISIFIIASLVVSTLLMKPEERMEKNIAVYTAENTSAANSEAALASRREAAANSPVQHAYTDKITQHTIEAVNDKVYSNQQTLKNAFALEPVAERSVVAVIPTKATVNPSVVAAAKTPELITQELVATKNKDEEIATITAAGKPASRYFSTLGLMSLSGPGMNNLIHTAGSMDNEEIWRNYPLLNAGNIIRKKLSKFNFQFYITPSLSYRQLTDAKGKAARSYTAIPLSANYKIDINNIVKHTPSAGAEVGFALGYRLNNRFTVKSGLQFNVRQYNIEAYPAAWSSVPDMHDGGVTIDAAVDALATSAHYTQAKSRPIILRNRYYEVAAPVGMDYRVFAGNSGAVTINVAATVQPTYTFDKEPFVITTDYKNYADGSSLMRNWNLNSSVEAYVSYKLGSLRWQIGPQFRYQHLPTYGGGYPIREHLLDYGIKLGFTKSLY